MSLHLLRQPLSVQSYMSMVCEEFDQTGAVSPICGADAKRDSTGGRGSELRGAAGELVSDELLKLPTTLRCVQVL